jgi:hypothetical protein
MIWLGLVLFLVAVVVWISLSRLRVQLYFSRVKDNDHFFAEFKVLGGLFSRRLEIPYIEYRGIFGGIFVKMVKLGAMGAQQDHLQDVQKQHLTPERISDMYHWGKRLLKHVKDFTEWLRHTLTHVKCSEFRWDTRLGIGDAAETALATGMLWAVKSTLFGYIFQYVHLETKPKLSIQPQYNHTEFSSEFSCHANIRIGFLIFSLLVLVWRIMKSKGGLKFWQTIFRRPRVQKA